MCELPPSAQAAALSSRWINIVRKGGYVCSLLHGLTVAQANAFVELDWHVCPKNICPRMCDFCAMALLMCGLSLPSGRPGTGLYVAAKGETRFEDTLRSSKLPDRPTGDFLVRDGKLYLKVQTIYHHYIDDTVDVIRWSPDRLSKWILKHPELARYLPDASRPDGGIAWFKNR